jgi:hypothetical protein
VRRDDNINFYSEISDKQVSSNKCGVIKSCDCARSPFAVEMCAMCFKLRRPHVNGSDEFGKPFRQGTLFGVVLGGLVVSVLATGPKVRGFNPGRGR